MGTNLLLDMFAHVYGSGLTMALISHLNMFALISSQLNFGPNINWLFCTRNICWEPKRPKPNFCQLSFPIIYKFLEPQLYVIPKVLSRFAYGYFTFFRFFERSVISNAMTQLHSPQNTESLPPRLSPLRQITLFIYLINKHISLSDIILNVHHWYK